MAPNMGCWRRSPCLELVLGCPHCWLHPSPPRGDAQHWELPGEGRWGGGLNARGGIGGSQKNKGRVRKSPWCHPYSPSSGVGGYRPPQRGSRCFYVTAGDPQVWGNKGRDHLWGAHIGVSALPTHTPKHCTPGGIFTAKQTTQSWAACARAAPGPTETGVPGKG